jgi:DNA-binding LacI/PurR family transcriptional regulator
VEGTLTLVERWPDIDGLLTYNDVMAMGAIRALASTKRTIPDDVAVVGFDNIGLSAHVNPSLTTIDLHQATVGKTAVEMLKDSIDSPETPTRHVVQPVQLVVRESTGIASGIRPAHERSRSKIAAGQSGPETM